MLSLLALKALPWRMIGLSALALAFLGMFAALRIEQAQNGKLKAQIEKCSETRKADLRSYQSAQSEAAARNRAEVAETEKQQQDINNEVTRNLNARIELLRRELRTRAAAPQSDAGHAGSSQAPDRPPASEEARVCIATADYVRAAENEEYHDQLITAVERLMALLNK